MKRKKTVSGNYLEKIPIKNSEINWSCDEEEKVTLEIKNKGVFNKLAQKLLKKPKISYIHLDELGSFVWLKTDGEKTIIQIGEDVKGCFGEKANPLYERLAQYFRILDSYKFIEWK